MGNYDSHDERGLTDDEETGLARGERNARKARKNLRTRLDQRVYPSGVGGDDGNIDGIGGGYTSSEEASIKSRKFWKNIAINGLLVLSW